MSPTVQDYMTPAPYSIGADRTLAQAHELMRTHQIRHLPVLEGGRLVGLVSERDLHLVETLKGVDINEVSVEEAMSQSPLTVLPEAPLREVAALLWEHKYGSVVVMDHRALRGVFTTQDALRALIDLLAPARRRRVKKKTPRSGHQPGARHGAKSRRSAAKR